MAHHPAKACFSARGWIDQAGRDLKIWLGERGLWWLTSIVVHALLLSTTLVVLGAYVVRPEAPADLVLLSAQPYEPPAELPDYATVIETEPPPAGIDLTNIEPSAGAGIDDPDVSSAPGAAGDADPAAGGDQFPGVPNVWVDRPSGVGIVGPGPVGPGPVRGHGPRGVPGSFIQRGTGRGPGMSGQTIPTDRAVGLALAWIARHQLPEGNWSIDAFQAHCKDSSCSGQGTVRSDAAATALALLPFLAAGETHLPRKSAARTDGKAELRTGRYRKQVEAAARWLIYRQKPDGDLSAGGDQVMYSHGLATIALAELYALSQDAQVGAAAQRAVQFIVRAQHPETGGWRYQPGDRGDTSVAGWQIMALKSAQIAGLEVPSTTMELARKWLRSTASSGGGLFSYEPAGGATPTMTAVGLLATQYLGAERNSPALAEGVGYLMGQMPTADAANAYYCYYATQVLHNLPGAEWDQWNRRVRKLLVEGQSTDGQQCSAGSWDPAGPHKDAWGAYGGRLMVTALNCLTLQVYYRYLPLYQLDQAGPK